MVEPNICDICGAPNALIRTITHKDQVVNELSGFTCEYCIEANVENTFVANLIEKLETNDELRKELAERFRQMRLNQKGIFIANYGTGVEREKCELCGQNYAYLCTVEDYKDDGDVEVLDEISGWFCADCITMGREKTCFENRIRDLIQFRIVCDNPTLAAGHFKEMADKAMEYADRTVRMGVARKNYTGIPVKTAIMTAEPGEKCICCEDECDHCE